MIQARELRIGNWVNLDGYPIQIESIHNEKGVNVWSETEWDISVIEGEHNIQPIPLTPEILEKCKPDTIKKASMDQTLLLDYKNNCAGIYDLEYDDYIGIPCKYMHQLQNLYFSLTNEELQIQL
jgi:hypothetical protein